MTSLSVNKLLIPYTGELLSSDYQNITSVIRSKGTQILIDKINWSEYPYKPSVLLFAGYSKSHLWLSWKVENDHFRAEAREDNDPVWEDSCVEIFIAPMEGTDTFNLLNEKSLYHNFEFNVLGICLSAHGNKLQRKPLSPEELRQILRFPGKEVSELPETGAQFDWDLTVAIPLVLAGLVPGNPFRVNFYKCGDLTRKPHFLSWNRIESAGPDFHLPQFFGEAQLVI